MRIHGISVEPGTDKEIAVNIARLPSHTDITITVSVRSELPGPVVLLMGGMHGDEINRIEIIGRFLSSKYRRPDAGSIISIPILNVYGFIHFSRNVPDGKDVN